MFEALADRVRYERTYSIGERWERGKEKAAIWLARRLPTRLIKWVVICRHADVTAPDQHPDTVSAFDLTKGL